MYVKNSFANSSSDHSFNLIFYSMANRGEPFKEHAILHQFTVNLNETGELTSILDQDQNVCNFTPTYSRHGILTNLEISSNDNKVFNTEIKNVDGIYSQVINYGYTLDAVNRSAVLFRR